MIRGSIRAYKDSIKQFGDKAGNNKCCHGWTQTWNSRVFKHKGVIRTDKSDKRR